MKKGSKIALGAIAALAGGWFIYKFFKKELSKIEKEEEADRHAVESNGVSYEHLQKEVTTEVIEEGNGFIKSVACFLFNNAPAEIMDVTFAETVQGGGRVIHVMQSEYKDHPYLDLMVELPDYGRQDSIFSKPGFPNIGEYIRTVRELAEQINNDIVKGPAPVVKPELYLETTYVNNGGDLSNDEDKNSSYFLVPREVFASYATDTHDGLNDFYKEMLGDQHVENGNVKALIERYGDIVPFDSDHYEVRDLRVFIKVSFRIAKDGIGVSLFTAPQVIQRMAEELEVKGHCRGGGQSVTFEHILIHPHVEFQEESGEIPCVAYEKYRGSIIQQGYLL